MQCICNFLLSHNFSSCEGTNRKFSLNQDCGSFEIGIKKIKCELFLLQAKLFLKDSNYEDSFNHINTLNGKNIVYINEGRIYETQCLLVHAIIIPSLVRECTIDLPVFVKNENGSSDLVFLVQKNDILRRKTKKTECGNKFHYENDEISVNRYETTIYIKNNDKNDTIYLRETVPNNNIEIPIDFVNFENYTGKINFLNETQFNKTLNEGTKSESDEGYLSRLVDEYSLKIESNKYFRVIRDGAITIIIFILILLLSKNKINLLINIFKLWYKRKYGIDIPIETFFDRQINEAVTQKEVQCGLKIIDETIKENDGVVNSLKVKDVDIVEAPEEIQVINSAEQDPPAKRKRGRPRKVVEKSET
jgi:hypothetical protein